jgi:hypothetical protein
MFGVLSAGQATCAAITVIGLLLNAGCGPKEAATTVPAKGQAPAPGTGVGEDLGNVKLTPEQAAARQRAIQQGPAIEAALKRGQGN